MSLDIAAVMDSVASHAMQLGIFDRVNTHEPKVAPGNGITCAIWIDRVMPVRSSGLKSTSVGVVFNLRLFTSMLAEPQDMIDPNLINALDILLAKFNADYKLGGLVRTIDIFGEDGVALNAQAGYVNQDNRIYRVVTVTLPVTLNDVWDQETW